MSTTDPEKAHDAVEPAQQKIDQERRALVFGGVGSLPVLVAGCGGGSDDQSVRGQTFAVERLEASAVASGFPILRKPTVGQLGHLPLSTPALRDSPPTTAFWLVIDAGTDARAVAVMSGNGAFAPRLELLVNLQVGTSLRLHTDRAIRSVHVARAGQSGYAISNGAQLAASAVVRWDFEFIDNIQRLEIAAHPPVVNTSGIEVECWGSAS